MATDWLPSADKLAKLNDSVQEYRIKEAKLIFSLMAHAPDAAAAEAAMTGAADAVDRAYKDFEPLITPGTDDLALMKRFLECWRQLHVSALKTVAFAHSGDFDAATRHYGMEDYELKKQATAVLQQDIDFNTKGGHETAQASQSQLATSRAALVGALLLGVALSGGMAIALIMGLVLPIGGATQALRRLASGDLSANVSGVERQDEIGDMVRALDVFKGSMAQARDLEAQSGVARASAEVERKKVLAQLAASFDRSVKAIVTKVAEASEQLQSTAGIMSDAAAETAAQARTVAAASDTASGNVGSVASATEQLSYSVRRDPRTRPAFALHRRRRGGTDRKDRPADARTGPGRRQDRRHRQLDHRHSRPDQHAGAERHHRSGARGRGRPRLRRGRPGSEDAGRADLEGHRRNLDADRGNPGLDPERRRLHFFDRADHRAGAQHFRDRGQRRRPAGLGDAGNRPQHPRGVRECAAGRDQYHRRDGGGAEFLRRIHANADLIRRVVETCGELARRGQPFPGLGAGRLGGRIFGDARNLTDRINAGLKALPLGDGLPGITDRRLPMSAETKKIVELALINLSFALGEIGADEGPERLERAFRHIEEAMGLLTLIVPEYFGPPPVPGNGNGNAG